MGIEDRHPRLRVCPWQRAVEADGTTVRKEAQPAPLVRQLGLALQPPFLVIRCRLWRHGSQYLTGRPCKLTGIQPLGHRDQQVLGLLPLRDIQLARQLAEDTRDRTGLAHSDLPG